MANQIKIKRGLEANRGGITPAKGEPLWTTDQKKLYVGDGATAGGVLISGGTGDMLKSTYDTGDNGVVDNSEKLEASTKAQVQDHTPKAHTLTSHSTKAHSELTGVGANDHHAQSHTLASHSTKAHSELTGIGSSDHHTLYVHPSPPPCRAATSAQTGHATAAQIGKLNGIETGATKYPDTGEQAFLDADHTKLDGIESGATVDQTKAEIDALGINAGQVDSIEGAAICQKSGFGMTGDIDMGDGFIKNVQEIWGYSGMPVTMMKGDFYPHADNQYLLGTVGYKWSDIYGVIIHEGDVAYAEKECVICNKKFKVGDNITMKVIRFDEETEEPMAIPIHSECLNIHKTFTKKYAAKEDYHVWDEEQGKTAKKKRNKVVSKTITKKKLKEDYEVDETTGDFWKLKWQLKESYSYDETLDKYYDLEGNEVKKHEATEKVKDKKATIKEATEEVQEEIQEVLYKEKEFII